MKRICRDEKGSSLVLTIVAVTFIALLATAVITMTITNIRLKSIQRNSQKNFYNADSIVDAVRAGVENLSDESRESAYAEAYASYGMTVSGAGDSVSEKYKKQFLTGMVNALSGGECKYSDALSGSSIYYKDDVIKRFLTDAQIANYATTSLCDHYRSHTDGKGDLILEDDTLLMKDICVQKTDNSFDTMINTDIRISVPNMSTETHSEYLNYALIADNQILCKNASGVETINGDIYSGIVKSSIDKSLSGVNSPLYGLIVSNSNTLNVNCRNLVSRGDILTQNNSSLNIQGLGGNDASVWVENIETAGKTGNNVQINARCNVSDDMEINGIEDSVTLEGEYYGYNYTDDYTGDTLDKSKKAEYSSSITINRAVSATDKKDDPNRGSSLNMSNLKTLVLAGRTFISKAGAAADIGMGESLTVRGTQLAYYVPTYLQADSNADEGFIYEGHKSDADNPDGQYINFDIGTDEWNFDTWSYNKFIDNSYDNEDDGKPYDGKFDITDYVDVTTPLTAYHYVDNSAATPTETDYFYLNFADDAKMEAFYNIYKTKSDNYSDIKELNKSYLSNNGIQLLGGSNAVLTTAGNLLYGNGVDDDQSFELSNNSPSVDGMLLSYAKDKSQQYMSLQMSLTDDYDKAIAAVGGGQWRLVGDKAQTYAGTEYTKSGSKYDVSGAVRSSEKSNLFNTIIQEDKIVSNIEEKDTENGGVIIVQKGDYEWNSGKAATLGYDCGIIIAKGDVTISHKFTGLVIAGGDIEFTGAAGVGLTIGSDKELLGKMFKTDKDKGDAGYFYNIFSKYFKNTVDTSISSDDSTEQEDNVIYESWTKNE